MLLALWFEKIASCYWLESLFMGGLSGPGPVRGWRWVFIAGLRYSLARRVGGPRPGRVWPQGPAKN